MISEIFWDYLNREKRCLGLIWMVYTKSTINAGIARKWKTLPLVASTQVVRYLVIQCEIKISNIKLWT